jgi:uncharacterized flavoprotein (TIGR03862 family)
MTSKSVAIIGAGPAGLFAAETLARAGLTISVFDQMASPGRKFLLAGRGGLNLTHSEPLADFLPRYGASRAKLAPMIAEFPPEALRHWADGLGAACFTGSSGRVFPKAMKASPLLRSWLARLQALGVTLYLRHRLVAIGGDKSCIFETPNGKEQLQTDAVLLACGGASWPRLGSDGLWSELLAQRGITTAPFQPSNSGILINWSHHMAQHAGRPLKRLAMRMGETLTRGEAIITQKGLEGGIIYALAHPLRLALAQGATARLGIDLRPDIDLEALTRALERMRKGETQTHALRRLAGLSPEAIAVLREGGPLPRDAAPLAMRIKATLLTVTGMAGLDRAISSVGGIDWDACDAHAMLKALPGVFVAGEMIDWDAPTGGYLLQACFSTAHGAAQGVLAFLGEGKNA